jgi:hypothetical protein
MSIPRQTLFGASWNPLNYLPPSEDVSDIEFDLDTIDTIGSYTREILVKYELPVTRPGKEPVTGSEVGDDRKDGSRSATKLACGIACQSLVVEMVTSWPDTIISSSLNNFCEVTSFVPCAPEQSYDYARKVGDFSNLGFNDSPILRIIMDVAKGSGDHSSTPVGKMSLLGSRVATPRAENRLTWMLASWLQDAFLHTSRATDPKYLPSIMGGAGVTPLFDEVDNLYLFVMAYRGGKYSRIYGTATAELESCLDLLERGEAASPVLCLRLRDKQEYLHGTYAEKVFVPTAAAKAEAQGILPPPLYTATGGANRTANVQNRLERSRMLITRTQAERDVEHHVRLKLVLGSHWESVTASESALKLQSMISRSRYEMALSANSALRNLLARNASPEDCISLLGDKAFHTVTTGKREFSYSQAAWLTDGGKKETYSIRDLTASEDMFVREEVAMDETFRISGIPLRPIIGDVITPTMTKAKVGLYEISSSQEEWAAEKVEQLIRLRTEGHATLHHEEVLSVFLRDREWVNDDTLLIQKCLDETAGRQQSTTAVLLVTNDRKLARRMADTCACTVYRLTSHDYVKVCMRLKVNSNTEIDLQTLLRHVTSSGKRETPKYLYIDTGSVASASAEFSQEPDGSYVRKQLLEATVLPDGRRSARYILRKTDMSVPLKLHKVESVTRPRMFRFTTRHPRDSFSLSFNSETGSWRANSESASSA